MDYRVIPWISGGLLLLSVLVIYPAVSFFVAYAAWNRRPNGFDRERFGLSGGTLAFISVLLMSSAIRGQADVRTWQYLLQLLSLHLGILLLGAATGCAVGIFTYDRGSLFRQRNPR